MYFYSLLLKLFIKPYSSFFSVKIRLLSVNECLYIENDCLIFTDVGAYFKELKITWSL